MSEIESTAVAMLIQREAAMDLLADIFASRTVEKMKQEMGLISKHQKGEHDQADHAWNRGQGKADRAQSAVARNFNRQISRKPISNADDRNRVIELNAEALRQLQAGNVFGSRVLSGTSTAQEFALRAEEIENKLNEPKAKTHDKIQFALEHAADMSNRPVLSANLQSMSLFSRLWGGSISRTIERSRQEIGGRALDIDRIGDVAFDPDLGPRQRSEAMTNYLIEDTLAVQEAEIANNEVRPIGKENKYWQVSPDGRMTLRIDEEMAGGRRTMKGFGIDQETGKIISAHTAKSPETRAWPISRTGLTKLEGKTFIRGRRVAGSDSTDIKYGLLSGVKQVVVVAPEAMTRIEFSDKIRSDARVANRFYRTYKKASDSLGKHEKITPGSKYGKTESESLPLFSPSERHRIALDIAMRTYPGHVKVTKSRLMGQTPFLQRLSQERLKKAAINSGAKINDLVTNATRPDNQDYGRGGTRVDPRKYLAQAEPNTPGEDALVERAAAGTDIAPGGTRPGTPAHTARQMQMAGASPEVIAQVVQQGIDDAKADDGFEELITSGREVVTDRVRVGNETDKREERRADKIRAYRAQQRPHIEALADRTLKQRSPAEKKFWVDQALAQTVNAKMRSNPEFFKRYQKLQKRLERIKKMREAA